MTTSIPPMPFGERETASDAITRHLIQYLVSGNPEPGTRIPSERALAEAFGVGRSAVRDALKTLSLLGIVEIRQGDGTYLRDTSDTWLLPKVIEWGLLLGQRRTHDLVETRRHLEVLTAQLAAERRTEADVADLRSALQHMKDAEGDPPRFVEADIAFHLRLAQASGNSVLSGILSSIQSLLRVWIARAIQKAGQTRVTHEEHLAVFHAVEASDPQAAAAAMTRHMDDALERLSAALAEEQRLQDTDPLEP